MPDAAAIVAEARAWVGTPFRWAQSAKGQGCDCKGLVAGVARGIGSPAGDSLVAAVGDYAKVDPLRLKAGLARLFDPVDEPSPGDVLLLSIAGKAQHLAIMVEGNRMIHCYARGPQAVVEVPMGRIWKGAIDSAWRFR